EGRNVHVELAKGDEGAVATQFLGNRSLRRLALFVRIAHDELAGFDRCFIADLSSWAASFNDGIVQSILEAEGIASFRQCAELHAVDDRDMREVVMSLARELQDLL